METDEVGDDRQKLIWPTDLSRACGDCWRRRAGFLRADFFEDVMQSGCG